MNKLLKITEIIMLVLVPAILILCACFKIEHTAVITLITVILSIIPFFIHFEKQKPRPRDIMPIVVLSAIAVAGRIIFAPFPSFKPVSAIVIISGVCFGKQNGFMTGAITALASNMFFGQGPWTPWQMYAWGLIGYIAGALNNCHLLDKTYKVCIYGFISALFYGFILDSWYLIGYISPITLKTILTAYFAGLPFSLSHAVATVLFLIPIFTLWRKKIDRIKIKYGIYDL